MFSSKIDHRPNPATPKPENPQRPTDGGSRRFPLCLAGKTAMGMLSIDRRHPEQRPEKRVNVMKCLKPAMLFGLPAVCAAESIVAPAMAHGSNTGSSVGGLAPLILVGGAALFIAFFVFVGRK